MRLFMITAALLLGCGYKTPYDLERDYADSLRPEVPVAVTAPTGQRLSLHVFADEDYRREVVAWRGRVEGMVARANSVLAPLGAYFEVVEFVEWRHAGGDDLQAAMQALREAAGERGERTWVLGLISAHAGYTRDISFLGIDELMGRFMIARAITDLETAEHLERELSRLDASDRQRLYRERRRHMEVMLLLHEWGHSMGAVHTPSTTIMHPRTNAGSRGFSMDNEALLRVALATPLETRGAEVLRFLEGRADGDWVPADRAELIRRLRGVAEPEPEPTKVTQPDLPDGYSRSRFKEARRLFDLGDLDAAKDVLDGLDARYPSLGPSQQLRCEIARVDQEPEAEALCARALPISPAEGLKEAAALLEKGEGDAARTRLASLHGGLLAGGDPEHIWSLAQLWAKAWSVDRAREALARLGRPQPGLEAWLQALSRAYGMRGVPADRQGAYVDALRRALAQPPRRGAFPAAWPGTAGGALMAALTALGAGDMRAGRAALEAAIAQDPEFVEAHLVLARLADREGEAALARRSLERALSLDETRAATWDALEALYTREGQIAALEGLRRRRLEQTPP